MGMPDLSKLELVLRLLGRFPQDSPLPGVILLPYGSLSSLKDWVISVTSVGFWDMMLSHAWMLKFSCFGRKVLPSGFMGTGSEQKLVSINRALTWKAYVVLTWLNVIREL